MTNYYRQCVPDYAKVAEPIVRLTRKQVEFQWGPTQGHAFGGLKALLVSLAVMTHPDAFAPYRLYTDAWDYAIGGILCQMDAEGVERVIQYISHQLNPVQPPCGELVPQLYITSVIGSYFVLSNDSFGKSPVQWT